MLVNQIAVFLENRKGRIGDFARVLANENIDLISMSIADTKEFGILRAITSDNTKAVKALKDAGFTVTSSDLIGIEVADEPGSLSKVLDILGDGGVDIEYLYSYSKYGDNNAVIMLKVSDVEHAIKVITEAQVKMLDIALI